MLARLLPVIGVAALIVGLAYWLGESQGYRSGYVAGAKASYEAGAQDRANAGNWRGVTAIAQNGGTATFSAENTQQPSCLKDGKNTNADGSPIICRLVNGKYVPVN